MIKGKQIKQRDTIDRPSVNYRALDGLNCSMIKLFDSDPVKFFEQFKLGKRKKDSKNTALIIGDIADFFLLDCGGNKDEFDSRFDEKFALFDGVKGSGQVFELVDILFELTVADTDEDGKVTSTFEHRFTEACRKVQAAGKYKGATEDKILADFGNKGYDYFESLVSNIGKVVVDVSLMDKALRVAELIRDDEFTKDLFVESTEEVEHFPKHVIEWVCEVKGEDKTFPCKSELDLILVNHKKKIIYPKDLKTTYDNENFLYGYVKYRYDLQAAFYYLAVKYWARENGMQDYTIEPMEFIVADTSANNRRPIRYQLTAEDMNAALEGYKLRGVEYKGIRTLIKEISWAEDTNNWTVSKDVFDNAGILKLGLQYDSN